MKTLLILLFAMFTLMGPQVHANQTMYQLSGSATTTPGVVSVPAKGRRDYLAIYNNATEASGSILYAKLDSQHSSATSTEGVAIQPGESFIPPVAPRNAIHIKSSSSTPDYSIISSSPLE